MENDNDGSRPAPMAVRAIYSRGEQWDATVTVAGIGGTAAPHSGAFSSILEPSKIPARLFFGPKREVGVRSTPIRPVSGRPPPRGGGGPGRLKTSGSEFC